MLARIYKPARTAMQSGQARKPRNGCSNTSRSRPAVEPLMGYTSSADMRRQIRLEFEPARRRSPMPSGTASPIGRIEAKEPTPKKISYSDNFRFGRPQPWTH